MPFVRYLLILAVTILPSMVVVNAQGRNGDQELRERGDGDRPERERGPRDGDRPDRDRGPRDGEHRDGDRPQPRGPIFDLLDRNHNGVLESEEIDQAIVVLRKMDRNGDGRLAGDEFGQRREGDRPPMRDGERSRGDRPPERQRPTAAQMKERFLTADKDGDNKLSKEEAPERLKAAFDRVDSDGSGFIEEAELDAMIRRFEEAGRGSREGQERGPREGDRGAGRERGDADRKSDKTRPAAE